ncbi:DUF58 domain-containing protein [Nostocoides jenkinsii]|uniref:DUF58 domain-containing protein n=1 Tax=Nostocoides jenkinsii Ben 74 TaxID=1193518 RepID=A0A077MGF6_9MICO|nr:DUF58 domain-containing protein [Tetrasphaera jenkinsii]CCI54437.1 conserved hypothetical protein [Tetrasphaera jenkinsii Ben 74]
MASPLALTAEALLRRVEWTVLRPLDGQLQGDYRTLFAGAGMDFRELREYVPGDDLRRIDWNVTARMDTPYVREYAEDRELTAWFVLDRSGSMAFGPQGRGKEQVLVEFTATLARLLTRGGNRVAAILYDGARPETVAARSGRLHVLRLIHRLQQPHDSAHSPTDLAGLLKASAGVIRQRSLVVVVSDFISAPGWEAPLRLLTQRHDVVPVQIVDPLESSLPDVGEIVLEDAETGERVLIDTGDRAFRERLRALAEQEQDQIRDRVRSCGLDLTTVSTADDLVEVFVRLAARRKLRR